MSARTKAPAITVPQSDDAADALLMEYGATVALLERMQADLDSALTGVKTHYEGEAKPHQERLKTMFAQLSAWGSAHRDRLTDNNKSKTVSLPAGEIGWRNRPPSVRWIKGMKVEDVVAAIKNAGMRRFLRIKEEPNKERMLEEPNAAALIKGVVIGSAGEEFFVAPFGADLAEPK